MQQHSARYWTVGKILALAVGLIVVAVVATFSYGFYERAAHLSAATLPHNVTVFGSAQTTGFGTTPFRVVFCPGSYYGGSAILSDVTCDGSTTAAVTSGSYSATLPNQHLYTAFIGYYLLFKPHYCDAGQVTLSTESDTLSYNLSC